MRSKHRSPADRPFPLSRLRVVSGAPPTPLMLCDRLITLAQEADRAGLTVTADHLVSLASAVFDERRLPA